MNTKEETSIIKEIKHWLNKPYYLSESVSYNFSISILLGLVVFLYLYAFKPFEMRNLDNNLLYYCLGFGIIVSIVILLYFFTIIPLFPEAFDNEKWTIKKQLYSFISIVIIISVANWFYNSIVQKGGLYSKNFTLSAFMYYTLIISILPIFIYLYVTERYFNFKRMNISKEIMGFSKLKVIKKDISKNITIYATNKKDNISFNIDDLVYITSKFNYASFFLKTDDTIKEYILRRQLINIDKELNDFNQIIRCHKSYIVNTDYIYNLNGNARGYYLNMQKVSKPIPVSRNFTKKELKNLVSI